MVVVRFKVGEAEEAALVRLNQKLAANADRIPPGVIGPIVKPRSIDDVPILAVTLWSARYGDDQLRALAAQLRDAIAEVTDVSEVTLIGGRPRQLRVDVDPARLAAYGLDPLAVAARDRPRPTRAAPRRDRSRAGRSPVSRPAAGCGRPTRSAASWSAPRAAGPCSCATWPRSWTAMPSPRRT